MKLPGPVLTFLLASLSSVWLLNASIALATTPGITEATYGGRTLLVYFPPQLPPQGTRALVVVLHGGLGNAQRIESGKSETGLKLDGVAEQGGFVVTYLSGTPVARLLGSDKLGWNAGGGCCGQPAEKHVDDVGYIKSAIDYLVAQYGIDRSRIFGMGHSNGAMMTQRLMCETGIYAAIVAISGPLNIESASCSAARGKRVLAIHGAEDANVPITGGRGTKGISKAVYNSEERTKQIFINAGASYSLQVVKGADHYLNHIENAIQHAENQSIAEKSARFFGLLN